MVERLPAYRPAARWLHWIIAAAVLLMIPAGLIMTREGIARPLQDALFLFHKNTGVLLISLILARIIYRLVYKPPPLPAFVPQWQRRVAALSHFLLYVLLIVMPVSGYIRVRAGGFPIEMLDAAGVGSWIPKSERLASIAQTVHETAAYLLIALLALHIGAALHHALIRRDGIWSRMWLFPRR